MNKIYTELEPEKINLEESMFKKGGGRLDNFWVTQVTPFESVRPKEISWYKVFHFH